MQNITSQNGKLIIARHHESEWNKLGLWTGSRDVHLTEYGKEKSKEMGLLIKNIHIDKAFDSTQVRSFETLTAMLEAMGQTDVPVERSNAHNERDYGEYAGKNKWDIKSQFGEDKFNCIRREWNCPVPGGETLKIVYERAVPFYTNTILPLLKSGKNILLVSHGNAIRALMKYIENIPDEKIKDVEMLFGAVIIYTVTDDGRMLTKEIRAIESKVNA